MYKDSISFSNIHFRNPNVVKALYLASFDNVAEKFRLDMHPKPKQISHSSLFLLITFISYIAY